MSPPDNATPFLAAGAAGAFRMGTDEDLTHEQAEAVLTALARAPARGIAEPHDLTELLQQGAAEEDDSDARIRKAEAKYRTLVEQIPAVTFMAPLDGSTSELYVSPQIEELIGFSAKEWLENPVLWYRQLHPEDRAHWQSQFVNTVITGQRFRAEYRFLARDGKVVWVRGEAKVVTDGEGRPMFLQGVAFDISESKTAEKELRSMNADLAERTATLRILQDVAMEANESRSVERAMRSTLRRICGFKDWPLGHGFCKAVDGNGRLASSGVWYVGPVVADAGSRLAELQRLTRQMRVTPGDGWIGRVFETGQAAWVDDLRRSGDSRGRIAQQMRFNSVAAFPVHIGGDVAGVLEFYIADAAPPDDRLREIMRNVGLQLGHVIERKRLEKAIADAAALQQSELGRELHDSVAQILTGVGMLAETLRRELNFEESPHADLAERLVKYVGETQQRVRRVSRGLMPVESDATGLMTSLERLAQECRDLGHGSCTFECPRPVMIKDNAASTQLYYIAREASYNAVRHSSASHVAIRLFSTTKAVRIEIEDDGAGMRCKRAESLGMGLSIMRHRAGVIGAALDVHSAGECGTIVTCSLQFDQLEPSLVDHD